MAQYWSDADGRFIECESVWDGRGSLLDGSGYVQRDSPYRRAEVKHGTRAGQLPQRKDTAGKGHQVTWRVWRGGAVEAPRCGCGRALSLGAIEARSKRCWKCVELRRRVSRRAA